ncbi:ABC transporter substrate-binding protein [Saccharopolyspora erythraea]|uniref:ABC transporter solute-binding protein n=2 Tax=Saccharopolyspora erythraea TaxID=1836 RepID=A4FHW9_SACEN|nr:ABC transporter substrate-binding protein [Saccharopolyspora erythraea]EQD84309.1 ABC transporter substrate-binding protein [Saccharopolyspora erythraea D]QRK87516.1 ABC transporter substrate-binding protein [Saccharopolyspora erythraea]CAM03644.1 putative ABC transporter solute-binding protein [Saccharopolyspora erythraea NRRL 2338]
MRNCDRDVVVEEPPRRAVSLNQSTTEIMLSLGLQDRMVGTATWTEPVAPHLATANARVPRLAENTPSFEGVLATEPDIVLGAYHAVFTDQRVASRDRFEQLGVPTYLSPSNCLPEEAPLGRPTELDDIYREVREIATIFGVPERGEALVAQLRGRVAAAQARVAGLRSRDEQSVLFWFARTESPYVAGGTGSPAIMARALGVRNAYEDVASMWPQVGWEEVLSREPTVLVLGDLTRDQEGDSLKSKMDFLRGDPAVSQLEAVRRQDWIPMSGTALNVSMRTVDGIEALADKLVAMERQG